MPRIQHEFNFQTTIFFGVSGGEVKIIEAKSRVPRFIGARVRRP